MNYQNNVLKINALQRKKVEKKLAELNLFPYATWVERNQRGNNAVKESRDI